MSVVNQMLKDLDRRQVGDQPVFTQHVGTSGSPVWMKIIIGLALLVIVALLTTIFFILPDNTAAPVVVQQAPPAITTVTVTETASPAVVEAPRAEAIVPPLAPPAPEAPPVSPTRKALAELDAPKPAPAPSPAPVATKAPTPVPSAAAPVTESAPAVTRPVPSGPSRIDVRPAGTGRTADGEFKRAVALINQGRAEDARAALDDALKLDAKHEGARQTLAVLLVESGSSEAAEALLAEGLRVNPQQSNFAVLAARLKLERGDTRGALELLRQHGGAAQGNAEYRAFTAALLQRIGRPAESVDEYIAALKLAPGAGVWWIGLGLSYEANGQPAEAADAYKRAQASASLSPDLQEFVERKLQTVR